MAKDASEAHPVYCKVRQNGSGATSLFMVTVDEGWRVSILCADMYEWAADWLVDALGRRPFAPRTRP